MVAIGVIRNNLLFELKREENSPHAIGMKEKKSKCSYFLNFFLKS